MKKLWPLLWPLLWSLPGLFLAPFLLAMLLPTASAPVEPTTLEFWWRLPCTLAVAGWFCVSWWWFLEYAHHYDEATRTYRR